MKSHAESELQNEVRRLEKSLAESESKIEKQNQAESQLKGALQDLHIHQEELRTQNEDLIQAHAQIEAANRKYQDLYNFAPVGFFSFDQHGKIVEVNLTGADLLGRYRRDLLGKPMRIFLDPMSKDILSKHLLNVVSGHPASDTIWLVVKDRPVFPAEIVSKPFDSDDAQGTCCRSAIKDISERHQAENILKEAHQRLEQANRELKSEIRERKKAEETLRRSETLIRASLREKEVLLEEIHHRVKNNMQVICSLLNLQAANIQDERLKSCFSESRSRINAMAMIHEMLYKSNSLSEIDLKKCVRSLASALAGTYGVSQSRINVTIDVDQIYLGIDQAIPCGLAINEILSNAFKYAFPQGDGEIRIEASKSPEKYIDLVVHDNGVGLPDDFDIHAADTLGLKLVWGLVERQLRGSVEIEGGQGTKFTLRFPHKLDTKERVLRQ